MLALSRSYLARNDSALAEDVVLVSRRCDEPHGVHSIPSKDVRKSLVRVRLEHKSWMHRKHSQRFCLHDQKHKVIFVLRISIWAPLDKVRECQWYKASPSWKLLRHWLYIKWRRKSHLISSDVYGYTLWGNHCLSQWRPTTTCSLLQFGVMTQWTLALQKVLTHDHHYRCVQCNSGRIASTYRVTIETSASLDRSWHCSGKYWERSHHRILFRLKLCLCWRNANIVLTRMLHINCARWTAHLMRSPRHSWHIASPEILLDICSTVWRLLMCCDIVVTESVKLVM